MRQDACQGHGLSQELKDTLMEIKQCTAAKSDQVRLNSNNYFDSKLKGCSDFDEYYLCAKRGEGLV